MDIKRILASPTHYSKVDRLKETRVMIDFLSLSLRFSFGEVLNRCLSRCFEEKAEEKKRGKGGGGKEKGRIARRMMMMIEQMSSNAEEIHV